MRLPNILLTVLILVFLHYKLRCLNFSSLALQIEMIDGQVVDDDLDWVTGLPGMKGFLR